MSGITNYDSLGLYKNSSATTFNPSQSGLPSIVITNASGKSRAFEFRTKKQLVELKHLSKLLKNDPDGVEKAIRASKGQKELETALSEQFGLSKMAIKCLLNF